MKSGFQSGNVLSRALAVKLGFAKIGSKIDDEDGPGQIVEGIL